MEHSFNKLVNVDVLTTQIENSSITIALNSITLESNNDLIILFKAILSGDEVATLNALVSNHVYSAYTIEKTVVTLDAPKTSSGALKTSNYEPEGSGATIVSHNFGDKCSWKDGSIQVIKGSLSNTGLVYSSDHPYWIDLEHGRIYDEDSIMFNSSNLYKVKVYIDDVLVTTGYTVDYTIGEITFTSAPAGTVTASYFYADKSWFIIKPATGKILTIQTAEVQFSTNTVLTSPFVFEPWFVGHPLYGTMAIPGQRTSYKNAKDFISACNGGQGMIPKWSELAYDVHVFPFNYARPKPVKHGDFIEIRIYCLDHQEISSEFATATFYVSIDSV